MTPERGPLVFGGSFDPPHRAHVELASRVADVLDCHPILFVPAAISPHKTDALPTAAEHRLAMLRLAIRNEPRACIDTIELDRGGVSYFIDTISAIAERYPNASVRFLIGSDQALAFPRWHRWDEILAIAEPAIVLRPPHDRAEVEAALTAQFGNAADAWRARIVDAPLIDVSATAIRERLAHGHEIDDLVCGPVAEYIERAGLYR